MPSPELDRLVTTGVLAHEVPIRSEFEGLIREAGVTLADAQNQTVSLESRFRLAYSAAHSIALAALRWHGYRPRNRQIVFQALAHTLKTPAGVWRMLARSHEQRNKRDYEGAGEIDERLLRDVIDAGVQLLERVRQLPPPSESQR
ncbi:MAG TPA: hypothetical protein VMS98_16200 [Thermoanaerobaculia bacterium]|nr:hypothetical protein [Thermoanaerobaculia bacterium]